MSNCKIGSIVRVFLAIGLVATVVMACDGKSSVEHRQPVQTFSAGGGTGESAGYRVRVVIGAVSPAAVGQSERHRVSLGAGAAQHGQQ